MAVIGCDIPVVVSGAESLSAKTGVWTKTHMRQEGHYLVATTYLVAAGSPAVFEFRVDLRPLEKVAEKIHAALHAKMAGKPAVGFSFSGAWKSIKKTAKNIGKTKLVKAVSGAVSAVTKNKVFQAAMPMAALGAHTTSKALGGKGVFTGPLGSIVNAGTGVTMSLIPGGAAGAAAAQLANPRTLAAFGAAKSAIDAAKTGQKLANTALTAQRALSSGNRALGAVVQKVASQVPATTAAAQALAKQQAARALASASAATKAKIVASVPAIKKAAAIKAKLAQPQVKATLAKLKTQADSAKKALQQTAYDAKFATGAKKIQAQQSAKIVNLVAANDAKIAAVAQKNAGGLPGILIDKNGRVTRGRFAVRAFNSSPSSSLLYTGPGKTVRGTFSAVAGVPVIGQPSRIANDIIGGDAYPSRIANDIIGACFQMQNSRPGVRNLRVSGTAPGLIGCDCGSEF